MYHIKYISAPNAAPPGVRCSPMTAHSILVTWDDLPPSKARGKLLGYRVRYSPQTKGNLLLYIFLN